MEINKLVWGKSYSKEENKIEILEWNHSEDSQNLVYFKGVSVCMLAYRQRMQCNEKVFYAKLKTFKFHVECD